MNPNEYSQSLIHTIEKNIELLQLANDESFSLKPVEMNWSRKEILGHLIDSAANNHHRFVKIQFENLPYHIISYMQDEWVEINAYSTQSKENLIQLWSSYNIHLAHVIKNIPEFKFNYECILPDGSKVTLEFIIKDYIDHMIHHLDQIYSK